MTYYHTTCHRDGTVSYWSVHNQAWVHRASSVPDRELAAMSEPERSRVRRHIDERYDARPMARD